MNKTNYNESKSFDGKSSHALKYKVMYFESLYFSDMTMEDYEERLTLEEDDKGNKYTSYFSHTLEDWVVIHARMRKYGGDCFGKRKTIRIKRGLDENTENENLLHEMIHAYISLLPEFHHSYLLLQFYDYLKKRIGQKKLNEYINYEAHKQVYVL